MYIFGRIAAIAFVLAAASPLAAGASDDQAKPASVGQLLMGAEVSTIDQSDGRPMSRGTVRGAVIERRCNLVVRTAPPEGTISIPLNDLRFVQGDGQAMLDVATRSEPRREFLLSVGPSRYQPAKELLSSLARGCGAKLVGPPPIVRTPSR